MSASQLDNAHNSPARNAGVPPADLRVDSVALVRGGRLVQNALSLAMFAGEVTLLRGPNGSGKSTLLRTIAGRLPTARGTIECDVPVLYIGHADGLSAALTGRQNLADWAMLNQLIDDNAAIDAALNRMQARAFADLPVRHLSHGQRRRVALARLTLGPSFALWLLDEPNSGLDAASSIALDDLISDHLKGGGMVLAATHLPLGITHSPRTLVLEDMA